MERIRCMTSDLITRPWEVARSPGERWSAHSAGYRGVPVICGDMR
ncbi:hypothetical protein RRG08_062059 [Elysia crispata]|uniref:Uncharacterized protein n=1 Tax=Elysia crispata TaxID=231223 RepID=A0AAE0XVL1_9GAST|nr:hypothetical protein RRG08_062059 [Elysia crispata]